MKWKRKNGPTQDTPSHIQLSICSKRLSKTAPLQCDVSWAY